MESYTVGVAGLAVTQLRKLGWFDSITLHNGQVTQLVECRTENPMVGCSSQPLSTWRA